MTSRPLTDRYPLDEVIRDIPARFYTHYRTEVAAANGDIAKLSNAFVNYHIALQQFSAMGRPVNAIHSNLTDIDLANDLVLIQDKVVIGSRPYRLLPLIPTAKQQWLSLLDHLDRLAVELARHPQAEAAAAAVRNLLLRSDNPLVPALFYLKPDISGTVDITRGALDDYYAEVLSLPTNVARSIFATEVDLVEPSVLEAAGAEQLTGTDVSIALGHNEGLGLDDPFGANSMRCPIEYIGRIGKVIGVCPQNTSWRAVESELRPIQRRNKPKKRVVNIEERPHNVYPFGAVARSESRVESLEKVRELVRGCFVEVLGGQAREQPTQDQIDSVRQLIDKQCKKKGVSKRWASRLYYLYLKAGVQRLGWKIRVKKSMPAEPEPSPLTSTTLTDYQRAQACRARFSGYLCDQGRGKEAVTPVRRIAEICIYVALSGAMATRHRLAKLPLGLLEARYQISGVCFVEIPFVELDTGEHLYHRLVLDDVAKHFVVGLSKHMPIESTSVLMDQVGLEIASILDLFDKKSWALGPWERLEDLSRAAAVLELPGVLRAVSSREFPSRTLPVSVLERLIVGPFNQLEEGARLISAPKEETPHKDWPIESPNAYRAQIGRISDSFNDAALMVKEEIVESNHLSDERKAALALKLQDILDKEQRLSFTCQVMLRWVIRLSTGETIFHNVITFQTVVQYAQRIFRVFKSAPDTRYMHNWSTDEFTEFYYEAVAADADSATDLVGRLMDFDAEVALHLERTQPVDWSAVSAVAKGKSVDLEARIDANIITEAEYAQVVSEILANTEFSELDRSRLVFLVFLGFRYGLRWSEAFYLKVEDLQYTECLDLIFVSVFPNELRSLKSPAARRRIPLVGELSEDEKHALTELLTTAELWLALDENAFLMLGNDTETALSETVASNYINALLKRVSGDPDQRFHHGRHTTASRLKILAMSDRASLTHDAILGAICPDHYYQPKGLKNLWGSVASETKKMQVIGTVLGHVSPSPTTNGSYIHTHEWLIHQRLKPWLDLSDMEAGTAAYIVGEKRDTVKRAVTRAKKSDDNFNAFDFYFAKSSAYQVLSEECEPSRTEVTSTVTAGHPMEFSLEQVYDALQIYSIQVGKQAVIDSILLPETVERVCRLAQKVELESGYSRFQLYRYFEPEVSAEMQFPKPYTRVNRYEDGRVREELRRLSSLLRAYDSSQMKSLGESLRLWQQYFIANRGYYLFPSLDLARLFLDGITRLEGRLDTWNLLHPDLEPSHAIESLVASFPGLQPMHDPSIRFLSQYQNNEQSRRIALRYRNAEGNKSSRRDTRLVIFVIAVWLELRN